MQYGPIAVIIEDCGRTYLSKKLGRYLNWTGHQAKSKKSKQFCTLVKLYVVVWH